MIILGLETATELAGAALGIDGGPPASRSRSGGRAHAETLVPAVGELLAGAGLTVGDLDVVAVDTGPGLFTGLRVGVATAKALGQGLGIGVLGLRSLDVLAAAAARLVAGHPCVLVPVVDARRGEVFASFHTYDGGDATGYDPAGHVLSPPALLRPEALARAIREIAEPTGNAPDAPVSDARDTLGTSDGGGARRTVVVVGDGADRYRDVLSAPGRPGRIDLDLAGGLRAPPPEVLVELARLRMERGAVPVDPREIVPEYLREADAAINWEQRLPPQPGPPPRA